MKNKNAIQGKARAGTLDVKSDRLMLLRLSGDKGSLGKIIDVNFEFCLQMKYDKKDLVGTRLSKLLPQMVAECHDDWMLASYESQKFNRLDAITTGCLRDKRGYFHFLTTAIKEIPNLKEGLSFLAALQINERMAGYAKLQDARGTPCMFICDRGGKVVGVNEEVTKVFRLTPGNIERDTEMNIEKLFPMLSDCDTGRAARSKDGILVDVKLNQYKEMNIENEFVDQSPDDAA
ncbi:MAG: hypothetical protein P4M11_14775 [Candidatus Pacebacteria bacterium]|nr:hypothetical protein [Candidatus Paceibacterota bacterium]